jgi:hypothetical protein
MTGTIYALAYSQTVQTSNYQISGYIQTFNISIDGTFISKIDVAPFSSITAGSDFAHCQFLDHLYNDVYVLIYTYTSGANVRGNIGTFCIAPNGAIYRTVGNVIFNAQLGLKATNSILPCYMNITNNIVAVCYQGDYHDGYIETAKITITDTTGTLKDIFVKAGSYAIRGNKTVFRATLTTTSGDKTLTIPVRPGWNYLVFTYDHTAIKFFNNLTNVSMLCSDNIQNSGTQLIFGGFPGLYDEFALYKTHLRDDEISSHYSKY